MSLAGPVRDPEKPPQTANNADQVDHPRVVADWTAKCRIGCGRLKGRKAVDAKADKYAAQDQEYEIVPDGVQKRVAKFHRDDSKGEQQRRLAALG